MGRGIGAAARRRGALIAVAIALAGCATSATSGTTITMWESRVERPWAVPATRLVVFEAVESPFFDASQLHIFSSGVIGRLKSCAIDARVEHLGPMDLDRKLHVTSALTQFRADAALMIIASGGNRTSSNSGDEDVLRYALDLFEVPSERLTWHADATLSKPMRPREPIGMELATSIVMRLRDEALFRACPPPSQPWPYVEIADDCHEHRGKLMREAAEISDPRERVAKMKTIARCL